MSAGVRTTFRVRNFCSLRSIEVGLCLALVFWAASARADALSAEPDAESEREAYTMSVRANAGLGGGTVGVGVRLGLAGEFWLTRAFGVGFEGGVSGQVGFSQPQVSAGFLGPTVALRSSPRGGTLFSAFGVAYAYVTRVRTGLLCLDDCPPELVTHADGLSLDLAVGWLGHPGGHFVEVGPVVRWQAIAATGGLGTYQLITLNLELGFALLERDPGRR